MLRYSLGTLLLVLLYCSIGCAALVNATGLWLQVAVSSTVVMLMLFTLAAFIWKEQWRVFAIGFAATGWVYFLLAFGSYGNVRHYLITDTALHLLYGVTHGNDPQLQQITYMTTANGVTTTSVAPAYASPTPYVAPPLPVAPGSTASLASYPPPPLALPAPPTIRFVDSSQFADIGHSLWSVLAAFAGGVVAQVLSLKSRARSTE